MVARHITTLTFSIPKFWTVKYVYSFSASTVQLDYEVKLQWESPIWFACGREVKACALESDVLGWIPHVARGTLFLPLFFFYVSIESYAHHFNFIFTIFYFFTHYHIW